MCILLVVIVLFIGAAIASKSIGVMLMGVPFMLPVIFTFQMRRNVEKNKSNRSRVVRKYLCIVMILLLGIVMAVSFMMDEKTRDIMVFLIIPGILMNLIVVKHNWSKKLK